MRMALIKSNYTPYGGGEKYTTRMLNSFVEKNFEVDVLTAESGLWDGVSQQVRLVTMKQFKYNNLMRLLTFNTSVTRHLKNSHYACIFSMDKTEQQTHLRAGGGSHAAWIERRCKENSALRCLSFKLNPFHRMTIEIERRALLSTSLRRIFCNSYLVKNDILKFYPHVESKIVVVHNGVEWHDFSQHFHDSIHTKNLVLKGLGLDPDRFYFLFLGSGYERKGLRKAIAALKLLPFHVDLIVVGKDKNESKYRAMSTRLKLGERVHFFGPQREVVPFLQAADAFILPTLYDPFSNASLEALAMGLYTVTSSANGCAEVISEGAGQIIEDLREVDSVAEAMKSALNAHLSKPLIRETVRHLDFDEQLRKIVDICIKDCRQEKSA